mgnify:CR=1 FL=1
MRVARGECICALLCGSWLASPGLLSEFCASVQLLLRARLLEGRAHLGISPKQKRGMEFRISATERETPPPSPTISLFRDANDIKTSAQ